MKRGETLACAEHGRLMYLGHVECGFGCDRVYKREPFGCGCGSTHFHPLCARCYADAVRSTAETTIDESEEGSPGYA